MNLEVTWHTVTVSGCPGGTHPLTWGQQEALHLLDTYGPGGDVRVDGDLTRLGREAVRSYADHAADEIAALAAATEFAGGVHAAASPSPIVRFAVWTLTDVATLTLMGDTTEISAVGCRRILAGVEALLIEAVRDPDADLATLAGRADLGSEPSLDALPTRPHSS